MTFCNIGSVCPLNGEHSWVPLDMLFSSINPESSLMRSAAISEYLSMFMEQREQISQKSQDRKYNMRF